MKIGYLFFIDPINNIIYISKTSHRWEVAMPSAYQLY